MPTVTLSSFEDLGETVTFPPSFSEFTAVPTQSHITSVASNHNGSAFLKIFGNLVDDGTTVPLSAIISDVTVNINYAITVSDFGVVVLQTPYNPAQSVGNFISGGGASGSGSVSTSLGAMSRAALYALFDNPTPVLWQLVCSNGNGGATLPWSANVNVSLFSVSVTFALPPTLLTIDPIFGPTAGGTPFTLTGTNFVDPPTVDFDGLFATSIVFVDATTVTGVTPAHAAGFSNVTITLPDLQTASLVSAYQFVPSNPNLESSPPFQTPGQWALHRIDLRPRREGPGGVKGNG